MKYALPILIIFYVCFGAYQINYTKKHNEKMKIINNMSAINTQKLSIISHETAVFNKRYSGKISKQDYLKYNILDK